MNIVCLCTALPAESRPLIEHFQLTSERSRGIRCYTGKGICLVETGIGKLKAATVVSALLHSNESVDALINIGIAGGTGELGSVYLANSITDKASNKRWYPHLPSQRVMKDRPTIAVHTVDVPSDDYQADRIFDMEASGVLTAGSTYLDNTRIQCIKVVSDNPTSDITDISKDKVSDWIGHCVEPVASLVDYFHSHPLSDEDKPDDIGHLIKQLSKRIRISVSDSHIITRLLQRHHALTQHFLTEADFSKCENTREIKKFLEAALAECEHQY